MRSRPRRDNAGIICSRRFRPRDLPRWGAEWDGIGKRFGTVEDCWWGGVIHGVCDGCNENMRGKNWGENNSVKYVKVEEDSSFLI